MARRKQAGHQISRFGNASQREAAGAPAGGAAESGDEGAEDGAGISPPAAQRQRTAAANVVVLTQRPAGVCLATLPVDCDWATSHGSWDPWCQAHLRRMLDEDEGGDLRWEVVEALSSSSSPVAVVTPRCPGHVTAALVTLTQHSIAAVALAQRTQTGKWELQLVLPDAPSGRWEPNASKAVRAALLRVLRHAGAFTSGDAAATAFDAHDLYARLVPSLPPPAYSAPLLQLIPVLKPHQKRAVAWMVKREAGAQEEDGDALLLLWHELQATRLPGGHPVRVFVDEVSGAVTTQPPPPHAPGPRGGILADEMGLGKTVTVLALLFAHPWTPPPPPSDAPAPVADSPPPWLEERVECACGACGAESDDMLPSAAFNQWVQCDLCSGWSHSQCVGYKARSRRNQSAEPEFQCGRCVAWRAGRRVRQPCGTTLVVCPAAIMPQWETELAKHAVPGALRVTIYNGQRQPLGRRSQAQAAATTVTAADLAAADVVLVSYDTLSSELHRDVSTGDEEDDVDGSGGRALRRRKVFPVVPSPLTRLTFWRICLDEAQLAESSTAAAAQLCRRLRGVHRWCVTGTPVSRGPDDIHGLLCFLQAPPLDDAAIWRAAVTTRLDEGKGGEVTQLLAKALKRLMWRTSRREVAAELALPPQAAVLTRLVLSPLETHFYAQQHSLCAASTARALRGDGSATLLPAHTVRAAMLPLLKLRQACDHPQVGASGLSHAHAGPSAASGQMVGGAKVMSMKDVHAKLLETARVTAEDHQRAVAMDCNALAGLALIEDDVPQAMRWYRSVLALEAAGERMTPPLAVDLLQRLHALHGLIHCAEQLVDIDGDLGFELAAWRKAAQELRDGYLASRAVAVTAAEKELDAAAKAAAPVRSASAPAWCVAALSVALAAGPEVSQNLCGRITEATQQRWQDSPVPFTDLRGAQLTLVRSIQALGTAQADLAELSRSFAARGAAASEADVYAAGRCGSCHSGTGGAGIVCMLCAAKKQMTAIEDTVFGRQMSSSLPGRHIQAADVGAGRSAPSSCETALRIVYAWAQRGPCKDDGTFDASFHVAAKAHLDALEALRKQFRAASTAALEQLYALASRDELSMSVMRLRLRLPHEMGTPDPVPVALRSAVLYPHDVPHMTADAADSYAGHKAELSAALSKLRWLHSLEEKHGDGAGSSGGGGQSAPDDKCPICRNTLPADASRQVLTCGHTLCGVCFAALARRSHGSKAIACPTCRTKVALEDVLTAAPVDAAAPSEAATAAPVRVDGASTDADVAATAGCPAAYAASMAMAAALCHPESGEGTVHAVGGWGTKIDAIVRRILWLRRTPTGAPAPKVIVFSEWLEVLLILQHALSANHVACARAGGGRAAACAAALAAFRRDEALPVLLLPIARGANGLTLVEACHVILVEPLLDAGVEAQATKRVDRIGQAQSTCVHRFLVNATVEVNVRALSARRGQHAGVEEEVVGTQAPRLRACDVMSLLT